MRRQQRSLRLLHQMRDSRDHSPALRPQVLDPEHTQAFMHHDDPPRSPSGQRPREQLSRYVQANRQVGRT